MTLSGISLMFAFILLEALSFSGLASRNKNLQMSSAVIFFLNASFILLFVINPQIKLGKIAYSISSSLSRLYFDFD